MAARRGPRSGCAVLVARPSALARRRSSARWRRRRCHMTSRSRRSRRDTDRLMRQAYASRRICQSIQACRDSAWSCCPPDWMNWVRWVRQRPPLNSQILSLGRLAHPCLTQADDARVSPGCPVVVPDGASRTTRGRPEISLSQPLPNARGGPCFAGHLPGRRCFPIQKVLCARLISRLAAF
jgi:hypothetical protein